MTSSLLFSILKGSIKDFRENVLFILFSVGLSLFYRPSGRYSLLFLIHKRSAVKGLVPEQFCLINYGMPGEGIWEIIRLVLVHKSEMGIFTTHWNTEPW